MGKSKSVIHSILRKFEETGLNEGKKSPAIGLEKLQQEKTDGMVMNKNRYL